MKTEKTTCTKDLERNETNKQSEILSMIVNPLSPTVAILVQL